VLPLPCLRHCCFEIRAPPPFPPAAAFQVLHDDPRLIIGPKLREPHASAEVLICYTAT